MRCTQTCPRLFCNLAMRIQRTWSCLRRSEIQLWAKFRTLRSRLFWNLTMCSAVWVQGELRTLCPRLFSNCLDNMFSTLQICPVCKYTWKHIPIAWCSNDFNPANFPDPSNPSNLQIISQLVARGAGGRGEALRFAPTPQGVLGVPERSAAEQIYSAVLHIL